MPALDLDLRLANSAVVDISAATSDAETAVNLGAGGLPDQATFVVIVEAGTADASVEPVTFELQFTDDNGTTWHVVSTITVGIMNNPAAYSVRVGRNVFAPEQLAAASIDVRCVAKWQTTAGTDDFTYSAYLAGPQSFPFFN